MAHDQTRARDTDDMSSTIALDAFEDEEIVRRCSHRNLDFEEGLYRPQSTLPDTILARFVTDRARSDLSRLDILPLEILYSILALLPYRDVDSFRNVNSRARDYVIAMPMFEHIVTFAAEFVASLKEKAIIGYLSLGEIHRILTNPSCAVCGHFGSLFSLPNMLRCCKSCLDTVGAISSDYPTLLHRWFIP